MNEFRRFGGISALAQNLTIQFLLVYLFLPWKVSSADFE
jgi:hypothetical protein